MALNPSGAISLGGPSTGQSIALELSLSPTATISLNGTDVRTLAGVASGVITMPTDFWGKSNTPPATELAIAHSSSPYVTAYSWSSAGFGTKFADPATEPEGTSGDSVAFSPAGTELAIGTDDPPYVTAYSWSSAGFGTKFADPATEPTGSGRGVAFSPAGTELAIGHSSSPYVTAYPWSSSGFGTKFANPATLPNNTGNSVAFS